MKLSLQAFEGRDLPDAVPVLPAPMGNTVAFADSQIVAPPSNQFVLNADDNSSALEPLAMGSLSPAVTEGSGLGLLSETSNTAPIPPKNPPPMPGPGIPNAPAAPQPQLNDPVPGRILIVWEINPTTGGLRLVSVSIVPGPQAGGPANPVAPGTPVLPPAMPVMPATPVLPPAGPVLPPGTPANPVPPPGLPVMPVVPVFPPGTPANPVPPPGLPVMPVMPVMPVNPPVAPVNPAGPGRPGPVVNPGSQIVIVEFDPITGTARILGTITVPK